ncbi:MAG: hypothetical protein UU08_C0036G0002 [Candidatus Uhrbacteria bacterium GW2011_GWE2_40_58]|nr:MAG: hypothetical protein UT94_C0059G0002 [Candidatus Uhrbacteria bacterium GW2011_GWF2_40_263]KKR66671.1 MAG: hypothetical protein UU08_C0036G0002 [Candidatus Uhrbacteria bacterium GW2011_GWE2_40_58]OGL92342.1 MAG: hypothetical protein A2239_00010 [Candidatus Uhrbacteria bacterium RIFOXYA2_FULL_40_9]OGL96694.1 MAG: hypothetical protein A2332_04935 [Candidatus Uhrbacteria bacterium RIFOXYB2_FULL_41_18]HBK34466.1 hypothetical protein [Candidatus Uhrbacteria bacterium]
MDTGIERYQGEASIPLKREHVPIELHELPESVTHLFLKLPKALQSELLQRCRGAQERQKSSTPLHVSADENELHRYLADLQKRERLSRFEYQREEIETMDEVTREIILSNILYLIIEQNRWEREPAKLPERTNLLLETVWNNRDKRPEEISSFSTGVEELRAARELVADINHKVNQLIAQHDLLISQLVKKKGAQKKLHEDIRIIESELAKKYGLRRYYVLFTAGGEKKVSIRMENCYSTEKRPYDEAETLIAQTEREQRLMIPLAHLAEYYDPDEFATMVLEQVLNLRRVIAPEIRQKISDVVSDWYQAHGEEGALKKGLSLSQTKRRAKLIEHFQVRIYSYLLEKTRPSTKTGDLENAVRELEVILHLLAK